MSSRAHKRIANGESLTPNCCTFQSPCGGRRDERPAVCHPHFSLSLLSVTHIPPHPYILSDTFSHVFFLSHTCISSHSSVPFLSLTIPTTPHTSCDCPVNKTKLVPVALEASTAWPSCPLNLLPGSSHLLDLSIHLDFPPEDLLSAPALP